MKPRKVPPIQNKHIDWLNEQLPTLIQEQILDSSAAERLKAYYEPRRSGARNQLLLVFSTLGSLLIMTGIISLLAYNWSAFPREFKLALAVGLLAICQGLAGWAALKHKDSAPWREGTAIALMAAVFISIALISQVYHLGGEIGDYLWICAWLSLPIAYLMGSTVVAGLYLITAFSCTLAGMELHEPVSWYWLMLAGVLPYVVMQLRQARYGLGSQSLVLLFTLTIYFLIGVTFTEKLLVEWWLFIYLHVLALSSLLGHLLFAAARRYWQNPLAQMGNFGILGLAFAMSSKWGLEAQFQFVREPAWLNATGGDVALLVFLVLATWGLMFQAGLQRRWSVIPFACVILPAWIAQSLLLSQSSAAFGTLCFNLYLLGVSIACVVHGVKSQQAGLFNGGVALFSLLLLMRFVDSDLDFIAKGIAFILIGMMFLGVNVWYSKSIKKLEPNV